MPEAENVETVRRMYDAFERGDLAAVVDLLDEDIDFKFQGPKEIPYTGAFLGRENVKKFFESVSEHVEGEAFNVQEFIASGDRVVVVGDERMRVKATGLAFEMEWADVFTLRDGKIVRFREYADTGAMLKAYRGEK